MPRIVVMGVSGSGKTSVGLALAERLGIGFVDADDLHPAANVEKMKAGIGLTDDDRWPWLDSVGRKLAVNASVVVACSALKRSYRDRIRAACGAPLRFIHLSGSRDEIATRMAARRDHYMPLSLLDSQFATLEPPGADEALIVGIDAPVTTLVDRIAQNLEGQTQ